MKAHARPPTFHERRRTPLRITLLFTIAIVAFTLWATSCKEDESLSTQPPPGGAAAGILTSADPEGNPSIDNATVRFGPWGAPSNPGQPVNSEREELVPVISKDGLSLYFGSLRPGGLGGPDIWVSQRTGVDAPWGPAQNLGPTINSPFTDNAPSFSPDGHRMYFISNRPGGFGGLDIYVSRRHDKRDDLGWQAPVNLGNTLNTAANERGPEYLEDPVTGSATLYFDSNRPGGLGDDDVYTSALLADGTFGPAVWVAELNTPFGDGGVDIRRDGLELILQSNRPGSLGGGDLWVATRTRTSDPWSIPANLGSAINSNRDEGGPAFSFDGTSLYFHAALRPGNVGVEGRFDVWVTTRERLKDDDN